MRPRDPDATTNFYRTELGKTLRIDETDEGAISVDILKDGVWSEAPRGMIGLRLSPGSRGLTSAEILALPT
jgi:hypothetical protein